MRKLPSLQEFFVAHGILTRQPRVVLPFHERIFKAIGDWVCGTLPQGKRNLAICMPPRHGKTYIARDLIAWGLCCFPDSEWIYTSYSATLAINQTLQIRECCASDWYRAMAPYVGIESGKGRQDWFRTAHGGAVYGVGTEGSLTGFGAGKKRPEFGGGIVIDDPLAALDALTVRREKCNAWYSQALYSRRNSTTTPILLIMQRLHEQDLVGYVQKREPALWHILQIPVRNAQGNVLWPETFSEDEAERMEMLDPFAFSAQYMQEPTPAGGAMFRREMIGRYVKRPENLIKAAIFADTAMKEGQRNDYSVLHYMGTDGINVYSLDMERGKWTAPVLLEKAENFYNRHKPAHIGMLPRMDGFFIEDKASGTGLIQMLRARTSIPVRGIQRSRDKVSRANDILPLVAAGRLLAPDGPIWAEELVSEMCVFSPAMTHAHDDIVDTVVDGLCELLLSGRSLSRGMDLS